MWALTEVKSIIKNQPKHIRDSEKEVLNYNAALEMLNMYLEKHGGNLAVEFSKMMVGDHAYFETYSIFLAFLTRRVVVAL